MVNYTDQEIINSLRIRENHVVAYISKKFLPMVKYMIKEMKAEFAEAEDIFQDALMIIIKKIDKDELKLTAKFSTYLYAVCKNLLEYHEKRNAVRQKYLIAHDKDFLEDENFSETYDNNYQYKIYQHYF